MEYSTNEVVLSLKDVSLKYKNNLILRDINFQVDNLTRVGQTTGQVVTILGKSGIGKTRLLSLISGLCQPTTGEIHVGVNQTLVKPGDVGMVLQDYPLFNHYTLLGNLKLSAKKTKDQIEYYLNEFNLYEHKDKYIRQLSGGQRQRTAIVQQLLCSEHFICLDEPFSGLDPLAVDKLCNIISKVASQNDINTILISSHILSAAMVISDEVIFLGNEFRDILWAGKNDGTEIYQKEKIPGATIVHHEDLAAQGLAWNSEIRKDSRFIEKVEEMRQLFYKY